MKKKIMQLADKIGHDKIAHGVVFTLVYITLLVFFSPMVSLIITAVLAALVELVFDKWLEKGTSEFMDWVASVIVPTYLYLIIKYFIL